MPSIEKYKGYSNKKSNKFRIIILSIFLIITLVIGVVFAVININKNIKKSSERKKLNQSYKKLFMEKNFVTLIEKMDNELKTNPFIVDFLIYRGYSFFFLGEGEKDIIKQKNYFKLSLIDLRKALAIGITDKNKGNVFFCIGKIYYYFGAPYYNLSIKYLKEAIVSGNNNIDLLYILGLVYSYIGNYEEAIKYFLIAAKIKESDYLLLSIAICFYKKNDYENSIIYLEKVIKRTEDPKIKEKSYFQLGEIYFNQKKFEQALDAFNKTIEININNAEAYFYRGEIYYLYYNDKIKARAEWRKSLSIDPSHIRALKRIY